MRGEEALVMADSLYKVGQDSSNTEPAMQMLLNYQRAIDAMQGEDSVSLVRKTKIYTAMGGLFAKQLLYQEAIGRYLLACECAMSLQDTTSMINAYQSLGDMFRNLHDLGEAVHYYDLAEQLANQAGLEQVRVSTAFRIAASFIQDARVNLAMELLPKPPYHIDLADEDLYHYVMWNISMYEKQYDDSANYHLQKLMESPSNYYRNFAIDQKIWLSLNGLDAQAGNQLYRQKMKLEQEMSKESEAEATAAVSAMYQALNMERQNAELIAHNQQIKYYAIISVLLLVLALASSVIIIYRIVNKRIQLEHTSTMAIRDSDIYQQLLSTEKAMNEAEQQEVVALLNQVYPRFISSLQQMGVEKEQDMKVCLLLKMGFKPSRIASLVSRTDSAIANTRARLYKKVFGKDGKAEDWDQVIVNLL